MKIELTQKEIELLLLLLNDAFAGDFTPNGNPILTLEERELIEKLESALRNTYLFDKGLLNNSQSNLSH
ncbi:MAG: hypothetical protein ABII64_11030 [Elusimicrobiota bacterium]